MSHAASQNSAKTLYLFVPAIRLDRVPKAVATGADVVIIDLEDAVAHDQKVDVRAQLIEFDATSNHRYWLRVNASHQSDHAYDLQCVAKLNKVDGIVLPKCQNPEQVEYLHQATGLPVIAVVETPVGVANIAKIATAHGLYAMSFGCLDLLHSHGVRMGSQAAATLFDKIRCDLLVHSLANGVRPPIDAVFVDFDDEDGLIDCVRHWADFGFGGQMAIHPKQIAIMKQALATSDDERIFAQKILAEYQRTGDTVFAIDGRMVDLPLILWAKDILGDC